MLELAGLAVSGFSLLHDLAKTISDLRAWNEQDIEVDSNWLDLALEKGVLTGAASDFRWSSLHKLPSLELRGTHSVVVAYNSEKRIRYRIVRGRIDDRVILVKKVVSA